MEIRPAVEAEASTVSRLLAEALRESYVPLLGESVTNSLIGRYCSISRIRTEIGVTRGDPAWLGWLVAATGRGEVVGAAAGGIVMAGCGELFSVCTAPAHRRRGVGSALLERLTDRHRAHRAREQWVSVRSGADPALPFLTRHGFRPPAAGAIGDGGNTAAELRCSRAI
ncbi:GNAT family N-acetyltransferase [Streptomyces gamaensis]